jgi:hypothetical protein
MRLTNAFRALLLSAILAGALAHAQVLAPAEILDPAMRELQTKYFSPLKQITQAAASHHFPYAFYFSRVLDLSEAEQGRNDQRSVQFDQVHGQTALKITGNYFASYSAELMKPEERARQTYEDVMLPLLQAAVPALGNATEVQAFAFEISHHVRRKVIGVPAEEIENVVLILPREAARRLLAASNPEAQHAALFEGEAFLNAKPISFWPDPDGKRKNEPILDASSNTPRAPLSVAAKAFVANALKSPVPEVPKESAKERATSPEALKSLQTTWQPALDRMVQEMNAQAHFVRYAPPAFIPFHKGLYLQVSLTTALPESSAGSQYKLAALAFDQHVAHLIRPALAYFKEDHGDFDGIDFATSIRVGGEDTSAASEVAVEFIFSLNMLRTYEQFDCTGQALLDSGYVLINGERVSLQLQNAEAGSAGR